MILSLSIRLSWPLQTTTEQCLGKSEKEPNQYPFGTSYDEIYQDLKTKVRLVFGSILYRYRTPIVILNIRTREIQNLS